MAHQLSTEDFDSILFDQFGVSREALLDRLDITSQQHEYKLRQWRTFLNDARRTLMTDHDAAPINILKQLEQICSLQNLLDEDQITLCEQLQKWRTDRESIASLISTLKIVDQIPPEGLDNYELESVLEVMQRTFAGVQLYKVQTRDFMFCDVQRRFQDPLYPSVTQMSLIAKALPHVDKSGQFKALQRGQLSSSAFGNLTGPILASQYAQGVDLQGIIINTARCDSAGVHWVAFVIDHVRKSIEVFDSTGQYKEELTAVIKFAEFLKTECDSIFDDNYQLLHLSTDVQKDKNSCGVYSLFYIYARILGADPQEIIRSLGSSQGRRPIQMFKEMMFGGR